MYTCKYCGKIYRDKAHLRRHEQDNHEYPPQKLPCPFCNQLFVKCGLPSHQKNCSKNPEVILSGRKEKKINTKWFSDPANCQFCGKECKNGNSLVNHERYCKNNPNRKLMPSTSGTKRSKPAWNKGLTKETDERIRLSAIKSGERVQEYYATHKGSFKGKHHSEETKEKLRQIALEHEQEKHFRRRCDIEYNGFKFHSTYESSLAENLDENHIKWIQPKRMPYRDLENKLHYYTADFYLPDYDIYLDPKNDFLINNINPYFGYKDVDKIKWVMEQNDVKILILNKDQLTWETLKPLIYAE